MRRILRGLCAGVQRRGRMPQRQARSRRLRRQSLREAGLDAFLHGGGPRLRPIRLRRRNVVLLPEERERHHGILRHYSASCREGLVLRDRRRRHRQRNTLREDPEQILDGGLHQGRGDKARGRGTLRHAKRRKEGPMLSRGGRQQGRRQPMPEDNRTQPG